ncbi:MAG: type II secretion system protein [Clostridia bacterium]
MLRKKNKGITLVALVVTIVVLLILAGISISALTNTGIFQKAKEAKQKSENASEKEQSLLYGYEDELSKYTSNDRWDGKVNKPEIMTGMTAIKFTEPTGNTEDTKGKEEKVSDSSKNDWYNYSEKKWANAKTNDGSMWVWIPRYAYKINKSNQTFDVVFLVGTTDSYYDKDGKLQTAKRQTSETDIPDATKNYVVHPAFTNESSIGYANGGWRKELTGIWISKFEAGYVDKDTFNANKAKYTSSVNYTQVTGYTPAEKYEDASNYLNGIYGSNATKITYPTFQGGKYSMNYINHSDAFSISRALTDSNNIYKLSNKETDSHLIKNSEWGAVSYLGQSQYGLNGTNICINNLNTNNSEEYVYAKTGYASKNGNDSEATNSTNDVWKWNEKGGTAASCTGTIYGIYDMSGGTWERSAAIVNNGNDSGNLNTYGKAIMNALNNGKSF